MCVVIMAAKPKTIRSRCLRRTVKLGSKLKLRLLQMQDAEAYKPWRVGAVKATIRKCLHREKKRTQLAKLSVQCLDNEEPEECEANGSPTVEFSYRHLLGAMAPENTTQFLMNNAYDDLRHRTGNDADLIPAPSQPSAHVYDESLSPGGVYAALDSVYESSLHFQDLDFEEVYSRLSFA